MIYEDYNRPSVDRFAEMIFKKFKPNKTMTLGIMQVATIKNISDNESVRIGTKILADAFLNNINNDPIEKALHTYNLTEQYCQEVVAIKQRITEQNCL